MHGLIYDLTIAIDYSMMRLTHDYPARGEKQFVSHYWPVVALPCIDANLQHTTEPFYLAGAISTASMDPNLQPCS